MLPFGSFSYTSNPVPGLLLVILVFLVFPRVPLFLACCLGGMKFLQGEGSMVIYCKKNYLLYKDATCHNLWPCDFTDVTAFSSLLFLALHYCFFLFIFFLLWLNFFFFFFYQVLFHGCVVLFQGHLSPLNAAFSGCFFSLFCPVLFWWLFFRAPISSDWFFVWDSLRPSSTQLLVRNHSGFCFH